PQKVQVFGHPTTQASTPVAQQQAIISFNALPRKKVGDSPFELVAISNNTITPITFASSDPAVASVVNISGKWFATVLTAGTAKISASQTGSTSFLAASTVDRTLTVEPEDEAMLTLLPEPSKKSGVLTLADYNLNYMYLPGPKPLEENYTKLFDGVLNEKIPLTWSTTLSPNFIWITFPEQMEMTLDKLRIYDGAGTFSPAIKFHYIKRDATKPGGIDWTRVPGPQFTGEKYMTWQEYALPNPLDIYAILIEFVNVVPGEIEIIGSWKPYQAAPYKHKEISINSALKTNGYIWNIQQPSGRPVDEAKMEAFKAFKGIRDYVDWTKIEKVKGEYTFEPASEGNWKYDMVYERLAKEGIDIHACLKNQTPWSIKEFGYTENNYEYAVAPWTKLSSSDPNYQADIARLRENPESYIYFSKAAFQYAARYGSNTALDPNLVKVASNQVKKIGLGYVKSIECNNETDASWHGRGRYMTPREYAYLLSVFYDGHMGTMGPGVGVKNADPNMLVVAGGIADNRPTYFQGVIDAWKEIRGYKADGTVNMACDIWNYHAYANNGGGQHMDGSHGLPPELSNMTTNIKDFLQIISEEGNDLPVWITEVGYAVNEGSQQALATPTRTKLQSHGDWTIRTLLFNIRNGIAETYFYQTYDESSYISNISKGIVDNRTYAACGLIEEIRNPDGANTYKRRPAASYMKQLQVFKDFIYQRTLSEDPFVDEYAFEGQKMFALAVPDMVGRTANYTLDLGGASQATIYRFADDAEEFEKEVVLTAGGKLTLTVSETPIFVVGAADNLIAAATPQCSATGSILREQWNNISGTTVASIPVLTTPSSTSQLTIFESPSNAGDNYGARIRGYVCPPQSGDYTFWIAGDDDCELWLSTNDDPDNKIKIAGLNGYTNSRQWNKYASQQSASVKLEANKRYYIEALHKEGKNTDYLAVAWTLPDGTMEAPIAGSRLSPFVAETEAVLAMNTSSTTNLASVNKTAELTAYPNPFTNEATLAFTVAESGEAALQVYDLQGRLVKELYQGSVEAGAAKSFTLKAEGLINGIYITRLVTGSKVLTQKIMLTK
ncbi:PA14 domain-containing protein, partial [Pontibacter silvestris]